MRFTPTPMQQKAVAEWESHTGFEMMAGRDAETFAEYWRANMDWLRDWVDMADSCRIQSNGCCLYESEAT